MFTDNYSETSKLIPSSSWEPLAKSDSSTKSSWSSYRSQKQHQTCPYAAATLSSQLFSALASSGCTLQTVEEWPPDRYFFPTPQIGRKCSDYRKCMETQILFRCQTSISFTQDIFSGCRNLESLLLRDFIKNCQYSLKGKQSSIWESPLAIFSHSRFEQVICRKTEAVSCVSWHTQFFNWCFFQQIV